MVTTVISLILIVIAFFLISAIIFQPSYDMKNKALVFIPVKKFNLNSVEADVRTVMCDVNRNYKRTVRKVYIVNMDDDMGILEICKNLCDEYDMLEMCSEADVVKILED